MNFKHTARAIFLCASTAAVPCFADQELNILYTPSPVEPPTFAPQLPIIPAEAQPLSSWICDGIEQNSLTGDLFVIQRPEADLFIMQPRIMGLDGTTWSIHADFADPEFTPALQVIWSNGTVSGISPEPEEFTAQGFSILFGLTNTDSDASNQQGIRSISFDEYESLENVCYLESFDGEVQVGCKLTSGHFSSFTITEEFTTLAGTYYLPIESEINPYQSCVYQNETPATGQSHRFVLP